MMISGAAPIRVALRSALIRAMKQRDREALAAYRAALAAIDNAEAVPLAPTDRAGAIEMSAVGAGRTEVQRRHLTDQDVIDIVTHETNELRQAAESLSDSAPETSQQLYRQAILLQTMIDASLVAPVTDDVSRSGNTQPG